MTTNPPGPHDQLTLATLPSLDTGPAPLPGEPFGDYVLHCELGRGGMGVVYKAFEPRLGRFVALKMILSGTFAAPDQLERFRSEASAAARLKHHGIVKVHHVGELGDRHYFTMDYIDGPSLAQKLSQGALPGKVAARYLTQVARAIHHAHLGGILHRDLKPGNILLDANDQPHVADFGLARNLEGDSRLTRTGALMGTPSYMAPEQARGERDLTVATDVYGLGAVLYELITGVPPFHGETAVDTVLRVLEGNPEPPRSVDSRIDRDLETICLKCLSRHPGDRYVSAQALADDLARYTSGEAIEARSMNMIGQLGRALDRSQFDVEFRAYGNVLLWFALIVGLSHVVKHLVVHYHLGLVALLAAQGIQFGLMVFAFWFYRPGGLAPRTTAERQLWAVWIAYVITCTFLAILVRQLFGSQQGNEGALYPLMCLVTGMAFFVLGASYWGMFYALAVTFYALSGLMLLVPGWETLIYGAMWTTTLIGIGLRLRKLGLDRAADR